MAQRLVLAHPKKLRIIAESTRQSDKLDAKVLAEFLPLGMIPEAYRPTPRQRQHRLLVRQRFFLRKRIGALKNKIHHLVANHNADRSNLFETEGQEHLAALKLPATDRFVVEQLLAAWRHHEEHLEVDRQLQVFARKAPAAERGGCWG